MDFSEEIKEIGPERPKNFLGMEGKSSGEASVQYNNTEELEEDVSSVKN